MKQYFGKTYLVTIVLSTLISMLLAIWFDLNIVAAISLPLFAYLSVYDVRNLEIPLVPTLVLLGINIAFVIISCLRGSCVLDVWWLIVIGVSFAIVFLVSRAYEAQVFGQGDYLIILALGLNLTAIELVVALEIAILAAAVWGVVLVALSKKQTLKTTLLPLVPFLNFGWLVAISFGQRIWEILIVN